MLFRDKLTKLIESLNTQLVDKGAEINGYMEKHNIQVRGQGGNENKKVPYYIILLFKIERVIP